MGTGQAVGTRKKAVGYYYTFSNDATENTAPSHRSARWRFSVSTCPIRRVLVVSYSVVPAGSRQGVCLESLLKALGPRFEVDVLTVRSAEMGYVERYRRSRMLRVPVGGGSHTERVEAFRRAIRRQLEGAEYDLIHFRSAYSGVPICQLKDYLDCRLVFELGMTSSHEADRLDPASLRTLITEERYCLEHADLIIAESEEAAKSVRRAGTAAPVSVVPPGVDVDTFDWEPSVPQALRRVVYAGRIQAGRGMRTLLEAFALLLRDMEAHLVLVGELDPNIGPYLQDAVVELSLQSNIHLLGELDHEEIPRVLAMADVCVAPWTPGPSSPLAGLPLKVLEYLACKRPAVVANGPTVPSLLGTDPPLVPIEPNDANALALALRQLLSEPHRGERLAERGYQLVRQTLSASASRRALLSAYSRIVPSGANLWGHADVVRPASGSFSGRSSSPLFRDTIHDADLWSGTSRTSTDVEEEAEPWVELTSDSFSGLSGAPAAEGPATDPEFVAAGTLLTGSSTVGREPTSDTNPQRNPTPKS